MDHIIPFWEEKSPDYGYGGYFTCFDQQGNLTSTDKYIWQQGRLVWFFSLMYNKIEKRRKWLDMALLGARFMEKYGRDAGGNWYFSLTREGNPLIQPYNIHSDCFACLGFGELYKASGNEMHKTIALETFQHLRSHIRNYKRQCGKLHSGISQIHYSLPMLLCSVTVILEEAIGVMDKAEHAVHPMIHELMDVFYRRNRELILQNVTQSVPLVGYCEERLLHPGYLSEAIWFIICLAKRYNDRELLRITVDVLIRIIEQGGIYQSTDAAPVFRTPAEWEHELWWIHIETLVALIVGYRYTGDRRCREWFKKIHNYAWLSFRNAEQSEWYGYLTREDAQLFTLKGVCKGYFHVPRGLYIIWKTIEEG
jgi:N-acylglucosamine 2-epimerase